MIRDCRLRIADCGLRIVCLAGILFIISCANPGTDIDKATMQKTKELYNQSVHIATQGDIEGAIKLLTEAIKLDPKFHEALYKRAKLYKQAGNQDLALADLEKATELAPMNPNYFNDLARIYQSMGRTKQAEAAYNRAVEIMQNMPALANPFIYFNRGLFFFDLERYEEAIRDFEKVLTFKTDPQTATDAKIYIATARERMKP